MKARILVVEDEKTISEPLAETLEREGFEAEVADSLNVARDAFQRPTPGRDPPRRDAARRRRT